MNTTDTNRRVVGGGVGNAAPRSSAVRRKILMAALRRRMGRVMDARERLSEMAARYDADARLATGRKDREAWLAATARWSEIFRQIDICWSRYYALREAEWALHDEGQREWHEARRVKLLPAPQQDRNVLPPWSDEFAVPGEGPVVPLAQERPRRFPLSGGAASAGSRCPKGVVVFSGTVATAIGPDGIRIGDSKFKIQNSKFKTDEP